MEVSLGMDKEGKVCQEQQSYIRQLISYFTNSSPSIFELGTPIVSGTEATRKVIQFKSAAVPLLLESLKSQNQKIVMYSAYCLGEIGDWSALQAIEQTYEKFMNKKRKTADDYAIISATVLALDKLKTASIRKPR
jgi:hypothetical protein